MLNCCIVKLLIFSFVNFINKAEMNYARYFFNKSLFFMISNQKPYYLEHSTVFLYCKSTINYSFKSLTTSSTLLLVAAEEGL